MVVTLNIKSIYNYLFKRWKILDYMRKIVIIIDIRLSLNEVICVVKKIIFIAGSYGVGKTTICNQLSKSLKIAAYSASDLISKQNNEQYGKNKYVKDSDDNQRILVNEVSKIKDSTFILNGHFCLKSPDDNIIILDSEIFNQMNLSCILLVSANPDMIKFNLYNRDCKEYDINFLSRLLASEKQQANEISKLFNIPLYEYEMQYDGKDVERILYIFQNKEK